MIFSDSKSVLTSLMSDRSNKNPLIMEIRKKAIKIMDESLLEDPIKLTWVPAHCGLEGNESVDRKAKEAAISISPVGSIPYSDFSATWKSIAREQTFSNNLQEGDVKGIPYFRNYLSVSSQPWFHNLRFNRREIVIINRIRANHYSSAASLFRKNIVSSPNCGCGQGIQDADHIFWQCSEYKEQRINLVNALVKLKISEPFSVENILNKMNPNSLKAILNFCKTCKLNL